MKAIGLFEAKTKFSEICEQVSTRRKAIIVTRRGKPFVKIEPISRKESESVSIWDRRAQYEKRHGKLKEDFTLPIREKQSWRNPLDN